MSDESFEDRFPALCARLNDVPEDVRVEDVVTACAVAYGEFVELCTDTFDALVAVQQRDAAKAWDDYGKVTKAMITGFWASQTKKAD